MTYVRAAPDNDVRAAPAKDARAAPEKDARTAPSTDARAAPAKDARAAPVTNVRAAPRTDMRAAPVTDVRAAPANDVRAAPAKDARVAPATDARAAPATDVRAAPETALPVLDNWVSVVKKKKSSLGASARGLKAVRAPDSRNGRGSTVIGKAIGIHIRAAKRNANIFVTRLDPDLSCDELSVCGRVDPLIYGRNPFRDK